MAKILTTAEAKEVASYIDHANALWATCKMSFKQENGRGVTVEKPSSARPFFIINADQRFKGEKPVDEAYHSIEMFKLAYGV